MKTTFRLFRSNVLKQSFGLAFCLGLFALMLPGCSQQPSQNQNVKSGKVVIRGSNTIGEELAPRLITEYRKEKPGVTIDLESKGTASGFSSLLSNQCDIAAASRVVAPAELSSAESNHVTLNCHMIGSYAVAVIVNATNSVKNVARDQVRDIFTGVIQNWKQVGGPDAPIHLCARDPISGTYLGFRELAMEDKPYAATIKTFTNYNSIVEAIAADPNAIGYCSINLVTKPGVKAISIRGVSPDVLAVNESRYPLARVLRLYTDQSKESPATTDFIQFVQSSRGQQILTELGYVPRP
jgi:phosphate transport system substrate-binding protein